MSDLSTCITFERTEEKSSGGVIRDTRFGPGQKVGEWSKQRNPNLISDPSDPPFQWAATHEGGHKLRVTFCDDVTVADGVARLKELLMGELSKLPAPVRPDRSRQARKPRNLRRRFG